MSSLRLLLAQVRGVFHKDRADRLLDDEIKNHLELLAADYVRPFDAECCGVPHGA